MSRIQENVLQILYPRTCPVCHDVVTPKGKIICRECLEELRPIRQPRCCRCGKSLLSGEKELCRDCSNREHAFTQGIGIYSYDAMMKQSIEYYKFHGRREYSDFYGEAMVHYGAEYLRRWRPDYMIPVPLHPRKKRIRGFNQAEYLAQKIGTHTGIPVYNDYVIRVIQGKAQKESTAKQRRRNLVRAFEITERFQPLPRVLLIDDVYTTGSTMDVLAGLLKKNGVSEVYFMTLCQGKGF